MSNPPLNQEGAAAAALHRSGLWAGLGAYAMWGLLPIYFKFLHQVSPFEIVAHRVIWSVIFLAFVLAAMRLYPAFIQVFRQPRILAALAASSLLIAANWIVYVWAVDTNHVVAASLGYFLNPLVNVILGTLVLKEKLRRGQAIAVMIAACGVAILAVSEWQTLWISLTLAISFAFYALVRKVTPVPSAAGLAVETVLLAIPALIFLAWLATQGSLVFGATPLLSIGLIGTGALTSVPLILFAVAARSLPMVTLGVMQYVAPSLQFISGIFLFNEPMSPIRWGSFLLIWIALGLFITDSLRGTSKASVAA